MSRRIRLLLVALVASTCAGTARADVNLPDHYLCYAAGATKVRKSQEAISGDHVDLQDRFGGPRDFKLRRLYTLCHPASLNGTTPANERVNLEGLTIKAPKGTPKFVPVPVTVTDAFATRTLVVTAPSSFLEVTPVQPDGFAADFSDDPTNGSIAVNRFACYTATLPKGSPKFVPPPAPTVTDRQYPSGQSLVVKNPTRVCFAVDADGATPGAETRDATLVCYAVKLSKGGKFARQRFGTSAPRTIGPRFVGRRKPAELCLAAH
jgi:hypothetical protein